MSEVSIKAMLELIVPRLVKKIIETQNITEKEALTALYASEIYRQLEREETKLWHLSVPTLFDLWLEEKEQEYNKSEMIFQGKWQYHLPGGGMNMDDKTNFVVYCIEEYKAAKGLDGKGVIELFNRYHVIDYIRDYYEALHTTGRQYIIDDISMYIEARQPFMA